MSRFGAVSDTSMPAGGPAGKTEPKMRPDSRAGFILALGRALHGAGEPSNRLEELLEQVAARVGLQAQFFITPTSLFAAFGPEDRQRTHLIRTEPSAPDLGRLARLDTIVHQVLRGELTADQGSLAVLDADQRARARPPGLRVLGYALASAGAARVLGGGWREAGAAGTIGLVIGLVGLVAARREGLRRLFEPIAAFLAALLVAAWAHLLGGLALAITTLASVIVLVPGMTLTNAMAELTTRHLASGTARLMSAVMTFVAMGFGVALAAQLVLVGGGLPPAAAPAPMAGWTLWLAILVASLSFGVLLNAEWDDLGWIVLSCLVGFSTSRASAAVLGPELGMFTGALAVGLASTVVSRVARQPSAVTEVPGLLILVPGSIGFRSVTALLDNQVVSGIEAAFRVLLIAMSLVAGLLVANLIAPAKPERMPIRE